MGQAHGREARLGGLPRTPTEMAARMTYGLDKDTEEPVEGTERVLKDVWTSAQSVGDNPLGMARSATHDILAADHADAGEEAHAFFDRLLAAPLSLDSATDDPNSVLDEPESTQFINRYLPGVVEKDTWDHTPIAAEKWDPYHCEWGDDDIDYVELARAHPGDRPRDDYALGLEDSTCDEGYDKGYQPLTTKAGSRLWSIGFAEPADGEAADGTTCTQLRAAYPLQLLVRFDRGRQMLVYEAFEYKPLLHCEVEAELKAGRAPVDEREMQAINSLVRRTREQMRAVAFMFAGPADDPPSLPLPPKNFSLLERCRAFGADALTSLASWVRFRHSVARRVRFPVASIVGARMIVVDPDATLRPHADLPPAEGDEEIEKLGEPSDEAEETGSERVAVGAELGHGPEPGPLGVLVLELDAPGADAGCTFAAMRLWPTSRLARRRKPCADWTPRRACSRATRHYIVGDACEIIELCRYLCHVSPHLAKLLGRPSPTEPMTPSMEVLATASNALSGAVAGLHPRATRRVPTLASMVARAASGAGGAGAPRGAAASGSGGAGGAGHPLDTKEKVNAFLRRAAPDREPGGVNMCLKAGLLSGNLSVPAALLDADADASSWLGTVILTGECHACGADLTCTVEDAMDQPECGDDYYDGGESAAVVCAACGEGNYVSELCAGKPSFECGKYHNHCTACPDFGVCIGDYRNAHCERCGDHYFSGMSGFECACRGRGGPSAREQMEGDWDSDVYDDSDDEDGEEGDPIPEVADDECWSGRLARAAHVDTTARRALVCRVIGARDFIRAMPPPLMSGLLEHTGRAFDIIRDAAELEAMPFAELLDMTSVGLRVFEDMRSAFRGAEVRVKRRERGIESSDDDEGSEDDEGLSAGDEEESSEDDGPSLLWGISLDQIDSAVLRFTPGDAVLCKVGGGWVEGTIVKLGYVQSCFPEGRCAPYQIRLGDGRLVFAPVDDDRFVRKLEIADTIADSVANSVTDPVADPSTDVLADAVAKAVADAVVKSVNDPVAKPITDVITDAVAKTVTDSVANSVTDPVADPTKATVRCGSGTDTSPGGATGPGGATYLY